MELAGLSNNHTLDYGAEGYADTQAALADAGVAYFDADHVAVWAHDGVMIGFTGSAFSLSTGAQKNLRAQMDALREVGCQLIVHSMHAGTEYEREPTSQQKTVAAHAVDMGADLVVGHHPHVVQGYELVDGVRWSTAWETPCSAATATRAITTRCFCRPSLPMRTARP